MLGKEQERGNGDLAAAQFWSSSYFSPKKLLWVSYPLPAYWKSLVKQEDLQNRRGTGFLFPSEIFSWERGRVLTGKRKVCNVAGRAFPSALPHSLCLAWSAILSPTSHLWLPSWFPWQSCLLDISTEHWAAGNPQSREAPFPSLLPTCRGWITAIVPHLTAENEPCSRKTSHPKTQECVIRS